MRLVEVDESPRHNLVPLTLSQLVLLVAGLGLQVFLARHLGQESFGTFSYLAGLTSLFQFAAHMNLYQLLARDVARQPDTAARSLGLGIVTTLPLALVGALCVTVYVWALDGRPDVVFAAAFAGLALGAAGLPLAAEGVLQGLRWMRPFLWSNLMGRLVAVTASVALVLLGADVPGAFAGQVAGSVMAMLVLVYAFRTRFGPVSLRVGPSEVLGLIRDSGPFALNLMFAGIYITADVLVVQAFHGDAEVGVYRVAALLVMQLPVLAAILARGLYPRMARHVDRPDAAGEELSFAIRVLLLSSVPIAVGGLCVAEPLVVAIVGEQYRAAWISLAIMLPLLPLRFLNVATGMTLTALNHQNARTRSVAVAAMFSLFLNFMLIPEYGGPGAAVSTLLTEMLLTGYQAIQVAPLVRGVAVVRPLLLALLPATVMAAVVLVTPGHVFIRIGVGVGVYVGLSFLIGGWNVHDVRRLRSI